MEFHPQDTPPAQEHPKATWPTRLIGFGLLVFAAVMLGCLLTYRVGEMGWAALNPYDAVAAAKVPCTNVLGVVGLYLAGMLYWLLGAGALYAMVLLMLPAAVLLFHPRHRILSQSLAAAAMLLCTCAILSVQPWWLQSWAAGIGLQSVGGKLGYLDGCCVLYPMLGQQGALCLLIAAHGVALIYFARMGFIEFCTAVAADARDLYARYREHAAARRARKDERRQQWLQRQQEIKQQQEAEAAARAEAERLAAEQAAKEAAEHPAEYPRQGGLQPRQVSPLERRSPAIPDEEKEALPPSLEEQLREAARRDQARNRVQQAPSSRNQRQRGQAARRHDNLLDLMAPVEERIALSNRPGQSGTLQPFTAAPVEETPAAPAPVRRPAAPAPAPRPRPTPAPKVNTPQPHQATLGLDTRQQSDDYPLPPYDLLKYEPASDEMNETSQQEMREKQQLIIDTLDTFGITVEPGDITRGPSITRYEFYPPRGLRVQRISNLSKELMLATQAKAINILAPIPGKNTVGIELENATKAPVYLRELLQSNNFADKKLKIPVALGKDVYGNAIIGDLAAMPHTLVAGTTGSGKSVCINSMILSMLYKFRPDELKLILVDPKVVEMQPYHKLPHLACPVVTVPARVIGALRWAVNEMEHRYQLFSRCGVRNFKDFNERDPQNDPDIYGNAEEEEDVDNPNFDIEAFASEIERQADEEIPLGEEEEDERDEDPRIPAKLPYIVIIIDELADLMMTVKEDLEAYIARLTQKARAAGIHLVAATQTPRAQVVTGTIKANIPSRIAFKVASPLDSRVILDTNGAENLLGKGDSLFLPPEGVTKMTRIQGAFVSDAEISSIVAFCAAHAKQKFEQGMAAEMDSQENGGSAGDNGGRSGHKGMSEEEDELYTRCRELVITQRKASTSLLQRSFSIGYGRAAKIMDLLEKHGVIAPASGNTSRPREVLIDDN